MKRESGIDNRVDKNKTSLNVGDPVIIHGIISSIENFEFGCTCTVEMPIQDIPLESSIICLNTQQVELEVKE